MKVGGFYEHQLPRPWTPESDHMLLKNALEQVELADRGGDDYIWATEHHSLEEYRHSSSPGTVVSTWSQRTAIRMLVEDPFTGVEGQYVKAPSRNVMPKPLQKPHPPLWMACSNRNSILQAAQHGVGALAFSFVSADEARPWVEEYYRVIENESDPIGYSVNTNFAIACPFLCDRDGDRLAHVGVENYGYFIYGLG